jgi:two-component system LytT family response regulator
MLRVLIVDDEPLARHRLDILLKAIPDIEVAGAAPDGAAARRMIGELRPDLVLLDIKMPGLNGFELLDALPAGAAPIVIFVTAFDHFAIEAFKRAAFNYLLKPVEPERLRTAIGRAREALTTRGASERVRELEEIIGNLRRGSAEAAPRFDREVWVQDRNDRLSLPVAAIDWVGAERDYVRIHTGGRSSVVLATGAELAVSRRCVARLKGLIGGEKIAVILRSAEG